MGVPMQCFALMTARPNEKFVEIMFDLSVCVGPEGSAVYTQRPVKMCRR